MGLHVFSVLAYSQLHPSLLSAPNALLFTKWHSFLVKPPLGSKSLPIAWDQGCRRNFVDNVLFFSRTILLKPSYPSFFEADVHQCETKHLFLSAINDVALIIELCGKLVYTDNIWYPRLRSLFLFETESRYLLLSIFFYFWFKYFQEYIGGSLCFTHAHQENGCLQNPFLRNCCPVVILGIFVVIIQYTCERTSNIYLNWP